MLLTNVTELTDITNYFILVSIAETVVANIKLLLYSAYICRLMSIRYSDEEHHVTFHTIFTGIIKKDGSLLTVFVYFI
jgi:hypothetical protein